MYKILYYNMLSFQPSNLKLLQDNFEVMELDTPQDDSDEILKGTDVIFAPLGYRCGKEKIDKMPNLKVIASNTTGEPHIDREYAERKGVKVVSLKYEQEFLDTITPTAEHTWGLLLALTRNTPRALHSVLGGIWNRRLFGGKKMVSRMTIGIVGLGRLGKMIAEYAQAFRMQKISYFDPFVENPSPDTLYRCDTLEQLIQGSDVVTLHVPVEKSNEKMFNEEMFLNFKKGSILINTSRAELVDEGAMVDALESGILSGAAVDVFEGEFKESHNEILQKSRLLKYAKENNNLLITPHIGGSTIDAWEETERKTIEEIIKHTCAK